MSVETPALRRRGGSPARVLTGFRPTGPLHVGHWAGNIENLLRLQEEHDAFFFIADWHMLTTHYDRTDELPGFTRDSPSTGSPPASIPPRATFYRQSDLPEVAEMALLLGMITPLGWLERVPELQGAAARHGRARHRELRAARLSAAADRGHHDRAGRARAGGGGPGGAPRAVAARSSAGSTASTGRSCWSPSRCSRTRR